MPEAAGVSTDEKMAEKVDKGKYLFIQRSMNDTVSKSRIR